MSQFQLYTCVHEFLLEQKIEALEVKSIKQTNDKSQVAIQFDTEDEQNIRLFFPLQAITKVVTEQKKIFDVCLHIEQMKILKYVIASRRMLALIGIESNLEKNSNHPFYRRTFAWCNEHVMHTKLEYQIILKKLFSYKWTPSIYKYCLLNGQQNNIEDRVKDLKDELLSITPKYQHTQIETIKHSLVDALLEIDFEKFYDTILYFRRVCRHTLDHRIIEKQCLKIIQIWINLGLELPESWFNFVIDMLESQKVQLFHNTVKDWQTIKKSLDQLRG